MNPLLSFRSLPSDVEHAVRELSNDECCLSNTSRLNTGSQNILITRKIIWLTYAIDGVKVAIDSSASRRSELYSDRSTHYLAESLSWYSLDLVKHSCTPRSCHSVLIAFPTSGGRLPPSICCGCINIVWTWYSWRWSPNGISRDSIASNITLIDCTVFEKMTSLKDSRSSRL